MGVRRWFHPPGRDRRTDSGASVTFDELRLCGHRRRRAPAAPQPCIYSKSSSTLFVRLPQARRLPSIHGPTIAPMLPPDGWRLQAELYSPASNKASARPQVGRVLQLFDSPLTHDPTPAGLSGETAETRSEVACDGHVTGDERPEVADKRTSQALRARIAYSYQFTAPARWGHRCILAASHVIRRVCPPTRRRRSSGCAFSPTVFMKITFG